MDLDARFPKEEHQTIARESLDEAPRRVQEIARYEARPPLYRAIGFGAQWMWGGKWWCREVGGNLGVWRKLPCVKPQDGGVGPPQRSLRHEGYYLV